MYITQSFSDEISKSRRDIFNLYISNFLKKYFLMLSWLLIVARALLVFNLIFNFHFNSSFSHFLTGYCHFIWWVILNVSILDLYLSHFSISTLTYIILIFSSLLFFCFFLHLQPEFRKCWDVFKILIKWKLKDFQITWANILFTIEHR